MSSSSESSSFTIGYYAPPVKFKELEFDEFVNLCKKFQIKLIELNDEFFDKYMYEHVDVPSFDLILYTLSDIVCEKVDPSWLKLLEYIRMQSSKTIIIDPPEKMYPLLDRYEQCCILKKASEKENLFYIPSFLRVLDEDIDQIVLSLSKLNIKFPIICKPLKCDAPIKSHYHKILFHPDHLKDCQRPYLLQEFIQHDALLFKVNIIGKEKFQIDERNSIRNLKSKEESSAIDFNNLDVCGYECDHDLSKQTEKASQSSQPIDKSHLLSIAQSIKEEFQLNLLSIDIISISNRNQYAVIDVNYFPCYNEIDNPSKFIFQMCYNRLNNK